MWQQVFGELSSGRSLAIFLPACHSQQKKHTKEPQTENQKACIPLLRLSHLPGSRTHTQQCCLRCRGSLRLPLVQLSDEHMSSGKQSPDPERLVVFLEGVANLQHQCTENT